MKVSLTLGLVVVLLFVGCGKEQRAEPETPVVIEASPELEAKLASADRADGTEDQVISQCLGCGLVMEGSDDHVSQVADYSAHFCSARCKDEFAEDPEGMLTVLAVEEAAEAEGATETEAETEAETE
jgi:hypothetical protein